MKFFKFFISFVFFNLSYIFFNFFQADRLIATKIFSDYTNKYYKIIDINKYYCFIKWYTKIKFNSFQSNIINFEQKINNFFQANIIVQKQKNFFNISNINFFEYNLKYSNNFYYNDYKILFILFFVSFFISTLIFVLSNIIGNSTTLYFERAKLSVYECGFQPFERIDKCQIFIFYRLAIFFIIFEAELIFLYPWAINICEFSFYTIEYFYNAFFFIFILFFGFFYEIKNKALDF
jgi:NADH:ubiquinone oxidoreductase subunit 3 (subunit A)